MTKILSYQDTRPILEADGHICLVFDDDRAYGELAARFVTEGNARNQRTLAFGPDGSALLERLRPMATVTVDPYVAFLERGPLDPKAMLRTFREQARLAARDGHSSLRAAADMDWLLPAFRSAEEVLEFEVLLDRVTQELDATVLCAYRRRSFEAGTIDKLLCTHPVTAGHDDEPPFKLVADEEGWSLAGEVDIASAPVLASTLRATAGSPWVVDVSRLAFADLTALRTIATTATEVSLPLELRGARPSLRRHWRLAGFPQASFDVAFTD